MPLFRILFAAFVIFCSIAAVDGLFAAEPDVPVQKRIVTAWGISSSASSFRNHEDWFPKMKEAGVSTIRLFPEWRGFEPQKGKWQWLDGDRLVKAAADQGLEINAILMGSPPGAKAVHAFPTKDYYVRATVRRLAAGNVGMNLRYEVADSQGRMPYANVGQWFGVSKEFAWQTYTWHCKNACFSKMWGYDFIISPEQSIPFAIGKIEVSTKPFK